jgi:hypothetical protein
MQRHPRTWLAACAGVAAVLLGGLSWVALSAGGGRVGPSCLTAPASAAATSAAALPSVAGTSRVASRETSTASYNNAPGVDVLHRWDRRRARAYAAGDDRALRTLYVPGSTAGERDVRVLGEYRRRGFRVVGMRMQVLAVRVLAHRRGRWRLRVTDRLHQAFAVRDGKPLALPRDQASTRDITLVRAGHGRWRVAAVTDARRLRG